MSEKLQITSENVADGMVQINSLVVCNKKKRTRQRTRHQIGRPPTAAGSPSRLATKRELEASGVIKPKRPIWPIAEILAEEGWVDSHNGLGIPPDVFERHLIAVGQTGSGKTTTVAFPIILDAMRDPNRTLIVMDAKGDLAGPVIEMAHRERGESVRIVRICFSAPDRSASFNPLNRPLSRAESKRYATFLSSLNPSGNESSFWKNNREQVLTELFEVVSRLPDGTLGEVANLVSLPVDTGVSVLEALSCPQTLEVWQSASRGSMNATTIIQDIASIMSAFLDDDILSVTSSSEFSFDQLSEPIVLILEFPEGDVRLQAIQGLFVSALFHWIISSSRKGSGRLATPITCVFDEFASLGRIPAFERVLNTFRSRGVRFVVLTQTLAQLSEVYREAQGSVLAGFGSIIAVPPLSAADAQYLSQSGGEMVALQFTSAGGLLAGESSFSRPVLTADEIRSTTGTSTGRLASTVLLSGRKPFQAMLPPIFQFKDYRSWNQLKGGRMPKDDVHVRETPLAPPEVFRTSCKNSASTWKNGCKECDFEVDRETIGYAEASLQVRHWWRRIERQNASRPSLVRKLISELQSRNATIQDLFDAHQKSDIDNIQGNLDFMSYLAARRRERGESGIPSLDLTLNSPEPDDETDG